MSKVFSVRLADDLAARVMEIAAAKGVKAPSVLKAAVEGYVDDAGRGPVEVDEGPPDPFERTMPLPPRQPERVQSVATPHDPRGNPALERQAKLNDARYGKGNW